MAKCEVCGKEHDGKFGSGRFCTTFCAHSFAGKSVDWNAEKEVRCLRCHKVFKCQKSIRQSTFICTNCRKSIEIQHKLTTSDAKHSKRRQMLKLLHVDVSPYREYDTVYEYDDNNGDQYLYLVKHDSDNKITKRQKVYLYRYLIELELGRKLKRNEVVHHIDGNYFNNDRSNLIVLTISDHVKVHHGSLTIEDVLSEHRYIFH